MPHIEIAAEKLFSLFGFPITNTLITSWVVFGLLLVAAFSASRSMNLVPARVQNVFELVVERFLDMFEKLLGTREKAEMYFPIVATIFMFVLISNWLGIFPGVGSIGFYEKYHDEERFLPLFRSAGSDLNVTLALGMVAVLSINIIGMTAQGIGGYVSKFFPVMRLFSFTFQGMVEFFVGTLELVSEFAKMISFSFRLFGNIFAGEVLLVITSFLMPYGAPLPFLMLEIFVGFVQALVFAMLTMVFVSIAVVHQHR